MPVQRDTAWISEATAEQIDAARLAGELNDLLGGSPLPPDQGQLTAAHLASMTAEQIDTARDRGQLDVLLGIAKPATSDVLQ